MTVRPSKIDTYIDHEGPVAERYQWWGVYLVRERRRLQGIAEAVASGTPLAATPDRDDTRPALPMQADLALPEGIETPDELLIRVDAELGTAEALTEMDESPASVGEEPDPPGFPLPDEGDVPGDPPTRQPVGRGALLGKRKSGQDGEDL